jgi:uncharacterized protein YuzE
MSELNRMFVRSSAIPTVEIDPSCHSVYIRFKSARIHKTISNNKPGAAVVTVDVDSKGDIIGVELVGVREFSIAAIRSVLPTRMKQINFERARFMPTASCCHEPAFAGC